MAYDFNKNFSQGAYGQGGRLSFQGGGPVPLYDPSQLDIGRPPNLGEGSWIDQQPDSVQMSVRRMMFPDVPYDWGRHEQQRQQWYKDQEFRDKLGLSNPSYPLSEENIKNYDKYGKLMKLRNEQAEKYALSRPSQRWNFGWRGDANRARAAELAQRNLDIEGLLLEQQIGYNTPSLRRGPTVMPSPVPVQGFQTGGRASSAFGLQSAGIQTQRDLEAQAKRQAEKQGKSSMWGNLLGTVAGLAGSYLLPGFGGPFANKLFGKALSYALPKAVTKAGVTSTYNPETYGADALFGKDKYADLTSRGEKFKSRGYEAAGVGALTDIGTAMMPNPLGTGRMGTPAEQFGIEPYEWGARLQNQIPTSASVYQNFGQNVSPGFQLGTDFSLQGGGRVPNYYGR